MCITGLNCRAYYVTGNLINSSECFEQKHKVLIVPAYDLDLHSLNKISEQFKLRNMSRV